MEYTPRCTIFHLAVTKKWKMITWRKLIRHLIMAPAVSLALYSVYTLSPELACTLIIVEGSHVFPLLNSWIRVWNLLRHTPLERGRAGAQIWNMSFWGTPVIYICDFYSGRFCFQKKLLLKIQNILKDDNWILDITIRISLLFLVRY